MIKVPCRCPGRPRDDKSTSHPDDRRRLPCCSRLSVAGIWGMAMGSWPPEWERTFSSRLEGGMGQRSCSPACLPSLPPIASIRAQSCCVEPVACNHHSDIFYISLTTHRHLSTTHPVLASFERLYRPVFRGVVADAEVNPATSLRGATSPFFTFRQQLPNPSINDGLTRTFSINIKLYRNTGLRRRLSP